MGDVADDVAIRRAWAHEAEEICQVTRLAFEPYRGKIRPPFGALSVTATTIRKEIRLGRRVYGVAVVDGMIVATLRYRQWPTHLGLSRLAVSPEYQCHGLGTRMMQWAEGEARRLGVKELRGEVRAVLPDLLEYYRRMGFRPFARRSGRGYRGYLVAVKKRVHF